ncbi:MAG: signal peptidase II [Planctomycetota bacterium]
MNETKPVRGYKLFLTIVVGAVALDLWSKAAAFAALDGPMDRIVIWEGVLQFREVLNSGMMWGMLQDEVRPWHWVLIRGGVLLGLVWLFMTMPTRGKWTQAAFGLVAGGAIGNIYDNAFSGSEGLFTGHVRDFINVYWFEFPVFNVADSCICVGAPLLLLVLWNQDRVSAARGEDASPSLESGASKS